MESTSALHNLFAEKRSADRPVSHDGQRFIGWAEFSGRVAILSKVLRSRSENRWLLTAEDPLTFAIELCAALYAGKQGVIPPNAQPGTLAALADAFDARLSDVSADGIEADTLPAIDPRAAIIDLYTSGSTGEHKRIRKTLAQFDAEVSILESLWGQKIGASTLVATAPHQHIYGLLFRLFWPLASGRVFDAITCADPGTLRERLAFFGKTALISSPAQLTRLPEWLPLSHLDPKPTAVFSSGAPLPARAARALAEGLGEAPIEIFGSTETGGVAWRQQNDETHDDFWTPFPCHTVSRAAHGALTLISPFLPEATPWEMDDGITLAPDGRFRLLGRLDRVVKIEEKRLSLPEMEARLEAHSWVEAAALIALSSRRQSIGAALALNAPGQKQLKEQGRRAVIDALRKYLSDYFDAVLLPRRWRFPECLPSDDRGKRTAAAIAVLFADKTLLPKVLSVDSDRLRQSRLTLCITPEIAHFSGHFPGAPILPGVVQVDWAIHFARESLPVRGKFLAVENLKFLSFVRPNEELTLSLIWEAETRRLEFSYDGQGRKYSAGRIVLGEE